ncbi:hypothetical protein [Roseibacillus persicicus]|uniref:Uncharacterized protein n=1 Tax=Roseibacillus persicicus TaxID=454148 RepID=A0A918TYR6_9BACT|nr:hypothetical protein [Roseibacillus persicicus]GHC68178.1 hypothetical protein GCM10007100_40290 [Roseibacillus persicicus]
MDLLPLLGKHLKDNELIDLLEDYDVEVVYSYDRLKENQPDEYWASIPELGIQLNFDENQILNTTFIFLEKKDGFEIADFGEFPLPKFSSKKAMRQYAEDEGVPYVEGQGDFFGKPYDWLRLDYPEYKLHYDFGGGRLKQISLSTS